MATDGDPNGTNGTNGTTEQHGAELEGSAKLITAIVQRGKADAPVQAALKAGAQGATVVFGRGQGIRERLGLLGEHRRFRLVGEHRRLGLLARLRCGPPA